MYTYVYLIRVSKRPAPEAAKISVLLSQQGTVMMTMILSHWLCLRSEVGSVCNTRVLRLSHRLVVIIKFFVEHIKDVIMFVQMSEYL
jgi:hypothetical protein